MPDAISNLLLALPPASGSEQVLELLSRPGLKVERIVSTGQASPPGFWYDQPQGEWVLLVQGEAGLLLEGEAGPRRMKAGDILDIPPHRRHRIEWTDQTLVTIWLAIHYD